MAEFVFRSIRKITRAAWLLSGWRITIWIARSICSLFQTGKNFEMILMNMKGLIIWGKTI